MLYVLQFPTLAVGNAELLHMIVGSIDGTQVMFDNTSSLKDVILNLNM